MSETMYLTIKELAQRWRLSKQTLANWRTGKKGPPFIRVGARILYPIEGVNAHEKISSAWLGNNQ